MKMYIYNVDTNEIIATVERDTNKECEAAAAAAVGADDDHIGWTYADFGLWETTDTEEL
jgi:hypothetical protein